MKLKKFEGNPILTWGGDNTGVGFESTLIDLIEFIVV